MTVLYISYILPMNDATEYKGELIPIFSTQILLGMPFGAWALIRSNMVIHTERGSLKCNLEF